jgi:hypothetical protein
MSWSQVIVAHRARARSDKRPDHPAGCRDRSGRTVRASSAAGGRRGRRDGADEPDFDGAEQGWMIGRKAPASASSSWTMACVSNARRGAHPDRDSGRTRWSEGDWAAGFALSKAPNSTPVAAGNEAVFTLDGVPRAFPACCSAPAPSPRGPRSSGRAVSRRRNLAQTPRVSGPSRRQASVVNPAAYAPAGTAGAQDNLTR